MAVFQYKSVVSTATVTETEIVMNCKEFVLVANDNLSTGDLYISFGDSIANANNYAVLKPGEKYQNLQIAADSIFVKSSTGSVNFRAFGLTGLKSAE